LCPLNTVQQLGGGNRGDEKRFVGLGLKQPSQIKLLPFRRDQDGCIQDQAHFDFKAGRFRRAASISRPNDSASFLFK
jgi:hypothetical protein